MKRLSLLAIAVGAAMATPAFADYDAIGTVDVSYGADRDWASPNFGGPVEKLRLTAMGGDVQCRNIRITYGNGDSDQLFTGILHQGRPYDFDMPGVRGRQVRGMAFACHAFVRAGSRIRIDADVGRYRDQWRQSPEWARTWARMMHWANNGGGGNGGGYSNGNDNGWRPDRWTLIGTSRFDGPNDRDNGGVGASGFHVTEIGLRAMSGDAVCDRMNVRFANGQMRAFAPNDGNPMHQGQLYRVDLPGGYSTVTNLALRCRALGKYSVSVSIYANK
jgi:hypothetical protein